MEAPVQIYELPTQYVNESAAYGPVDLKEYFQATDETAENAEANVYSGSLVSGEPLPDGMICTSDGLFTGIPAKGTSGTHEVLISVENAAGRIDVAFTLIIKPAPVSGDADFLDKLKAQVWEAVENDLPVPDFGDIYAKEISALEIYYLLERWGIIKIWDAFNLDPPGEMHLIQLPGMSEHYHVYDRGSCLVAAPVDLFSHERTLEDGLKTARAMADEVYKRGWTVELSGFDKLTRAAWVQIQHLGDKHGKKLDVINFDPSPNDVSIYTTQANARGIVPE